MRPSAAALPRGHACIVILPLTISYFPPSNDYVLLFHFSSSSRRISQAPSLLLLSPLYRLPLSFPPLVFPLVPKGCRELEHSLLPPRNSDWKRLEAIRSLKPGGTSSIITTSTSRTLFQHGVAVNCPSFPLGALL